MQYPKRPIIIGLLCNLFHYYAFSLYLFSAILLSPLFFETNDITLTKTLGLITVSLSLLIKPVGAVIFGHIGDRYGTKRVLVISLISITLATFCIGLIPSVDRIGALSSFLLIVCLSVQGICLGGQYTGALLYIQEHMAEERAGFACGLVVSIGVLGTLLGTLTTLLFEYLTQHAWSWRVPFLLTLVLGGILTFFMTGISKENKTLFQHNKPAQNGREPIPLMNILIHHKKELCSAAIISAIPLSMFYLATVYVPNFFTEHLGDSLLFRPLTLSCLSQAICVLFVPVFGLLGDMVGKRNTLLAGSLVVIFISPLLFGIIDTIPGGLSLILSILSLCLVVCLYGGPSPAFLSKAFPKAGRFSGIGLGISLGEGIFGGLVPIVCLFLQNYFDSHVAPSFFISFLGVLCLVGIMTTRKEKGDEKYSASVEGVPLLSKN